MKRTTTYDVIISDIASNGDYINTRGDTYTSWKEALKAYRHAKWFDSKDTLVELRKTVWEHEDEDPYDCGDIVEEHGIYSKEIR